MAWRTGELSVAQVPVLGVWSNFRPHLAASVPIHSTNTPHVPHHHHSSFGELMTPSKPSSNQSDFYRGMWREGRIHGQGCYTSVCDFNLLTFI